MILIFNAQYYVRNVTRNCSMSDIYQIGEEFIVYYNIIIGDKNNNSNNSTNM